MKPEPNIPSVLREFAAFCRVTVRPFSSAAPRVGTGSLALNVTASSGTGGVRPVMQFKDPVSGAYLGPVNNTATYQTATGLYVYQFYPGAANSAVSRDCSGPSRAH